VKWLNRAKLEYLEDTLVIWVGQLNGKNGAATGRLVKEQMKVLGQQMSVTNSVHKNYYVYSKQFM
jgi:hypothetical protein